MLYDNIEQLIGNTPLLKIDGNKYNLADADIYMKLEYLNPFGSIKDRTVMGLTEDVRDKLNKDYGLIESSSGNTAKALALIASRRGAKLTSVTNRIKVPEVEMMIRYLDVDIVALPGRSECPDPNDADNPLNIIYRMEGENPDLYYHTRQYDSQANPQIHAKTTAAEIYATLGEVDVFVSGVGTGGSSGGVVEYGRQHNKDTTYIGVISDSTDFLPGIRSRSELFETALFNVDTFHDLIRIGTPEALDYLRKLVLNEGVLAGPTTGANFAAAIKYAKMTEQANRKERRKIVCIACDRIEYYMSYIAQRQPEIFARNDYTDIYQNTLSDQDVELIEKSADSDIQNWIDENNIRVVDMRSVNAFSNFRIKSSVNYPESYLLEALSHGTPFDNESGYLFVCPSGDRSLHIASVLKKRGIDNVFSLAGGLAKWRAKGLPLERGVRREL